MTVSFMLFRNAIVTYSRWIKYSLPEVFERKVRIEAGDNGLQGMAGSLDSWIAGLRSKIGKADDHNIASFKRMSYLKIRANHPAILVFTSGDRRVVCMVQ